MQNSLILTEFGSSKIGLVNLLLIQDRIEHLKEYDRSINISGIYGNFPCSKLAKENTTSYCSINRDSRESILKYKKTLNSIGVSLYLDCSNPYITDELLTAYYDNVILEALEDPMNYVSVSSETTLNYIRNNFQTYSIVIDAVSKYTGYECDDLNIPRVACKDDVLKVNKGYAILLLNPVCLFCKTYPDHLDIDAKANAMFKSVKEFNFTSEDAHLKPWSCFNRHKRFLCFKEDDPQFVTREDLQYFSNKGVHFFKIESYPFYTKSDYLDTVLYYLALPEYKEIVKSRILHRVEEEEINNEFKSEKRMH